jgi:hypothetical protein
MTEAVSDEAPEKKKPGRKPAGSGMHLDADGYLVIHRGPWRNRYAHRAYAARQWKQKYGTELPDTVEIHHSCGNRSCWPPSDGHLVVMDLALHHEDTGARNRKRRGKRKSSKMRKSPAQGSKT